AFRSSTRQMSSGDKLGIVAGPIRAKVILDSYKAFMEGEVSANRILRDRGLQRNKGPGHGQKKSRKGKRARERGETDRQTDRQKQRDRETESRRSTEEQQIMDKDN